VEGSPEPVLDRLPLCMFTILVMTPGKELTTGVHTAYTEFGSGDSRATTLLSILTITPGKEPVHYITQCY